MIKKKFLSVLIVGLLCTACGGNNNSSTNSLDSTNAISNSTSSTQPGSTSQSTSNSLPNSSSQPGVSSDNSLISNSTNPSISSTPSIDSSTSIVVIDIASVADEYLLSVLPTTVAADIELPTTIPEYDFEITWVSNKKDVLTNDGTFLAPVYETEVTLRAQFEFNDEVITLFYTVTVVGYSDEQKLAASLLNLTAPAVDYYNRSASLPQTNSFGATITWDVGGSAHVNISLDNNLVVAEEAFDNGDMFTLIATVIVGTLSDTKDFEYEMPKVTNYEPAEITVDSPDSFSWTTIENAVRYKVKILEINKEYTVLTNSFSLKDRYIPVNTEYNVIITPEFNGPYRAPAATGVVGTISALPKVVAPQINLTNSSGHLNDGKPTDKENPIPHTPYDRITALKWTAPAGATQVRVYCDGYLFRTVAANTGTYDLIANGVITQRMPRDYEITIQFVGNYTSHQSSIFQTVKFSSVGNGTGCPVPEGIKLDNGVIRWNAVNYPNGGYLLAFNDFLMHYGGAGNTLNYMSISEITDIPYGTYSNVRVKAISNSDGTPSAFSTSSVSITLEEPSVDGPDGQYVDNDFIVHWNALEKVMFYQVNVVGTTISDVVTTNSVDYANYVSNGKIVPGIHTINIYAWLYTSNGAMKTLTSSFDWTYEVEETQLSAPTNIVATMNGITWDPVDGAVGYELIIENYGSTSNSVLNGLMSETTKIVATNEFDFIANGLKLNLSYSVKIRSLAAKLIDHSIFSATKTFNVNLKNVALSTNGASIVSVKAGAAKINVPDGTGNALLARIINGNGNNWQATPASIVELLGLSKISDADAQFLEIILAFNNEYEIYQFVCYWNTVNAAKYTIDVSTDGENWTEVVNYSMPVKREIRTDVYGLAVPVTAKYMKITCTARGDTGFAYNIYGFAAMTLA